VPFHSPWRTGFPVLPNPPALAWQEMTQVSAGRETEGYGQKREWTWALGCVWTGSSASMARRHSPSKEGGQGVRYNPCSVRKVAPSRVNEDVHS
jgi:hypothetical protein